MQNTLIVLALSTLLIGTATAARADYTQLLQHTGITQQTKAVRGLVSDAAADNRRRCKAAGDVVPDSAATYFEADVLIAQTLARLQKRVPDTSAARLLEWFHSDLAQKIAILEQTNPASIVVTADTREVMDELAGDRAKTHHPRALALIDIATNTGVARYTAAIGTEIEYAGVITSGCLQHYAANSAVTRREHQLAQSIRSEQSLLRQIVAFEAPLDMAQQFQSLSDAELQAYRQFTQSDDAQHFYHALIESFSHSLMLASDQADQAMQATGQSTARIDE